MNSTQSHWRWFFIIAALEAGAAFFALLIIPREGRGFSIFRLAILGALFSFSIIWIYFAARRPKWLDSFARRASIVAAPLLSLTLAVALFLLRYLDPARSLPYFQRLSPLLFYLLVLALQASFFLLFVRYGLHREDHPRRKSVLQAAFIAFIFLLFSFFFISLSRIGLTPDKAYWGEPGVPFMGWQFALALLGGLVVLCIVLNSPSPNIWKWGRGEGERIDVILPILIWLLAVIIWLNVPISVMQNSFYAPINPPTNLPLPNSDAGYYDSMAHSLLIGYPYQGDIPTRPLYILLLAILHLLAGERYSLIIAGQTLILAFIPVVLYFLGKRLHSRVAGVIVALFAIFRELTSLLISSQTRVSNTKTLLVDLPTFLLIALACLFVLRWLERKDWKSALAAGGMFGILMLLRTQSMLILPFILLAALPAIGWKNKNTFLLLSSFFLAGIVFSVTPWLTHNYLISGRITFDAPFEYQVIASQYKYTGNLDLQSVNLQGKGLLGILLTFALQDPKYVLGFIAAHFFATQISGILALPLIQPYNGLFAPINLYWMQWDGSLSWYNLLLVVFYLAIIALGLGASWKRLRWAGLIPLAFSLGYSLANGIGRFSGWRYAYPADWISYFYFGIGVAEIFAGAALLFGADAMKIFTPILPPPASSTFKWVHGLLLAGVFAFVGASPWMAEGIASPRYAGQTSAVLSAKLSASSAVQRLGIDLSQISIFTAQPQAVLQIGRLLYPRFFTRGTGLSSANPWPAYAPRDFPRMGFLLLNQTRKDALFPARQMPDSFPQAADAVILGCQRADYIEVRLILFPDSDSAYLSAPLTDPCP
ncbi:MAG: glycosyltransferase family 39 protein [Chloroflexi bacterium]|nr:glycosyltransferase family 39 protein [Chloroflexota bacterium]